jgi:dGTPase
LTHDLGHPPFGHGGEVALNYCMRDSGGFEGNAQSLRILTKLEKFSEKNGANLTRRALLGILKYPAKYSDVKNEELKPDLHKDGTVTRFINTEKSKPPKCYFDSEEDTVKWIFQKLEDENKNLFKTTKTTENQHKKTLYKSFDCSIMDIADDIAYGVHDLEDVIALGLIKENDFRSAVPKEKCKDFIEKIQSTYYSDKDSKKNIYYDFVTSLFSDNGAQRKRQISRLVHYFIVNVEIYNIDASFNETLFKYNAKLTEESKKFLDALKEIVVNKVIKSPKVQHLEFKGQMMVVSVFEVFASDPKLFLPQEEYEVYNKQQDRRVICDYIAGMTDGFLLKTYERLFSPRMGSIFDKL